MSKHSNTSNTPGTLALDYLIIPGWVSPVQPVGLAHGGVSIRLAEQENAEGLLCMIDPWPDSVFAVLAVGDRVNLHVNGDTLPVDGKTIGPGEENSRVMLYVPIGELRNGVNQLHYEVTRPSDNNDKSDPLNVLFYRPGPTSLRLALPADVLENGVNAARAEQGVVCACYYSTPHAYDKVYLTGNSATVSRSVAAGQNSPILFTLYTDFFREAGDNPAAPFYFVVEDQLGNRDISTTVYIDIHLDRVDLDLRPPVVLEAREANGTRLNFQRDFYEADFATVTVNYTGSAPGQTVKLYAVGRANTYGSEVQTIQTAGQTLTFRVPRLEVVDSIGSLMTFYYTVRLPGTSDDKRSRSLGVNVTSQPLHLPQPTLIPGNPNPNPTPDIVRVTYPELVGTYRVRVRLYGVVVRDTDEIYIDRPNQMNIEIPRNWLTENQGREVIFNYTLRKTDTNELIQFSWCLRVHL